VYEEEQMVQQQNGHDCGMFVLAATQELVRRYSLLAADGHGIDTMRFSIDSSDILQQQVSSMRQSLLNTIQSKAQLEKVAR
jgi:Ulp1 family protease